ncbi:cyclase family protein [Microbacterium sp. No. 7]|uniref:cyclase family protein n=1 Tax=Microbacterium sp. No. 7 TaxID=1714373 RepID=UPI0006CF5F0B|nr:cyclase family protein [Microbacterium sp. No. 7]ALJ18829.1 hypothetical protein AOA12_02435 [Microbacterium sp. No. 7]
MVVSAEFEAAVESVSNWGRWGADDQRGTLNLITEETRRAGLAAVKDGTAFNLAMELGLNGPQDGSGVRGRVNPIRTMLAINDGWSDDPDYVRWSDDIVVTPIQAATHWDALSHVSWRGTMYNGIPASAVTTAGATKLGIDTWGTLVSHGVLLDVARHTGVDRVAGGVEITGDMLEDALQASGARLLPGSVALIRTGQVSVFFAGKVHEYHKDGAGLGISAARWFHEHDLGAVAIDNTTFDLLPSKEPGVMLPAHILDLVMMGMPQGQNFVLEELADACAADGRYEFLIDATPARFEQSTGGFVTPVVLR